MWHGPDALDAAPLEFVYATLGMVGPGRTERGSRSMLNVECGAIQGVCVSAAVGVAAAADASGVSGPWLEEAKLRVESPGIDETWVPLVPSTARGLSDAVVCICDREGASRAPPSSSMSAGILPSAQNSVCSCPGAAGSSPPAWDIRGGLLRDEQASVCASAAAWALASAMAAARRKSAIAFSRCRCRIKSSRFLRSDGLDAVDACAIPSPLGFG